MKNFKKLVAIVLIMAMMVPTTVFAKDKQAYAYKVIDLAPNSVVTARDYTSKYDKKTHTDIDTFQMYRIKITQPGVTIFYCSNKSDSMALYRSFKNGRDLEYSNSIIDFDGKRAYYQVLPKGTYYLHVNNTTKIRYAFYPTTEIRNYCRSTATKLPSGKAKMVSFQIGRECSQWYRLPITNRKSISVKLTRLDDTDTINCAIYTKKGKRISISSANGTLARTKMLEPDNYYLRVWRDEDEDDDDFYLGRVAKISWQ